MTYWWTSAFHLRGAFLAHLSVQAVPMSKVSPRTFSFLIIPQPYFNQFWVSRSPSLPRCPSLNLPRGQMHWKERGPEEGWQACVTTERFTWGHKSQGEREGGIVHIKGSVCEDREVNWPSQSRRLDSPYAPPAHTPIHTLPSGWRLFSLWTKHSHPNIPSLWLTLLSCVSVRRTRTLTLFYRRPLRINHREERNQLYQLSTAQRLGATSGPSGLLTPSIPMWACVDGSQGTALPGRNKRNLVILRVKGHRLTCGGERGKGTQFWDVYEKPWEGNPSWQRKQFMSNTR